MSEPDDILRLLRHVEPGDGDDAARGDDGIALADLIAGRIVGCDSVAAWLGGWHRARIDASSAPAPADTAADTAAADTAADVTLPGLRHATRHTLVWTRAALVDGDRLRRLLVRCGGGGDQRLAAAIVTAMVHAIVDGVDARHDVATLPVLPPLMLRLRVERTRLVVLGLRWQGTIT